MFSIEYNAEFDDFFQHKIILHFVPGPQRYRFDLEQNLCQKLKIVNLLGN